MVKPSIDRSTAGEGDHPNVTAVAVLDTPYIRPRVLLFGSAARGEATEHSDVDLLIVLPTTEKFYQRMASVHEAVRDLSLGMPLAPRCFFNRRWKSI
jgi:hypothetical protein